VASQTPYEQAMRSEARRLVVQHGDLVEVRCLSGPPDPRIELLFADGHQETITQHSGGIDISMMKFGYSGTGTECFWAFLDEAGFKDLSLEQLQTMEGPQVLRKGEPQEQPIAHEEDTEQGPPAIASQKKDLPLWRDVSRDASLLDPLVLQQLEKSMCVLVRDDTGPVAAMVVRASPDEFRGPLTQETEMSLYIHTYQASTFQLYGVYPMVWDDPKEPFFKETWIAGAGAVTGPEDPLSEGQLTRLESLLTQEYCYFLLADNSNQVIAARKVPYTPATQERFLGLLPGVRGARSVTISNTQLIAGVAEYMNRVSLEEIRQGARELMGLEAAPVQQQPAATAATQRQGERTYPWQGKSVLRRVGAALLGLVWFFLCSWAAGASLAMQGVEPNWLLYLLMAFFVLAVPVSCLVDALRPTRIREVVVSPSRGLVFRRKSGEEKPVFAKIDRLEERKQGKRFLLHGRSPQGNRVRAEINRSNLPEGDFDSLRQGLLRLAPATKVEVTTRRVVLRRVVAALCSIPATFGLLGALSLGSSIIYDRLQGTTSLSLSLQNQIALTLGLFAAFLLFAALATVVSDRRRRIAALWSFFLVLGLLGAGVILMGITGRGPGGSEFPVVAPLTTILAPGPTPTPGSPFADQVVAYNPGQGQNQQYAEPQTALGAPDLIEQPCCSGMLQLGAGGSVLLAFTDNAVLDESGPDLEIFGESARDDFILVEVSADGETWHSYPMVDECPDPFDLADVGLEEVVFVRITDVQPGTATGAELDAVEALHSGSPLAGGLPQDLPDALARVDLNLTEEPGDAGDVVCQVPAASVLTIEDCNSEATWVQVTTSDGHEGWCSTTQLALNVSLADYREPQPAASPAPAPQAPAVAATSVELGQALAEALVRATITGQGLERIDLLLESLTARPLEINIQAGTIFLAQTGGTQNMVVRRPRVVELSSQGSREAVTLSAACASMELDAPEESDHFAVSTAPVPEDLIKLLNLPAFLEEPFRVQQFAIWTITDNPPRGGYVGLGYFAGAGSGPSDEEMQAIRALFQQAGISTESYQAFQ
jgi:hypothetical protein